MLDTRALTYFLAVAETGSVSAAAEKCFVTQPAVSRQVAALERQLGIRIFRRVASGMVLTPGGERFLELAQDILNRHHRATEVMNAVRSGHQDFTVACPETTGNFFLAPFVASGGGIADIVPAAPDEVYALLRRGVDMAVNTLAPPPQLASRMVLSVPITCQSVPGLFPLAEAGTVELREVAGSPLLLPGAGSAVTRAVQREAGRYGVDLSLGTLTSNGTLAQARAAAGYGSALVIEPPQYGLASATLVNNGRPLIIDLYAAWEPDHYAADRLEEIALELGDWMPGLFKQSAAP